MLTFNVKGQEFQSSHSDVEIAALLRQYLGNGKVKGDFPSDLVTGYNRYGRFTDRQRPWAHFLVWKAEQPVVKPQNATVGGFLKIVEHMRQCRDNRNAGGAGLLNPMVRVELNGVRFTLKLAGGKSRHAGKVSVAESSHFGEGRFFGWIGVDGAFERYGACTNEVVALLQRIAADPAKEISEIGKESGHCCYCWAELSQVQSKIAGCGKTCADNYNVPYPNAEQTRAFVVEHPEVLVGATDADRWSPAPQHPLVQAAQDDLEQLAAHLDFVRNMEGS